MQDKETPPEHFQDRLEEFVGRHSESEAPEMNTACKKPKPTENDKILKIILSASPSGIVHTRDNLILWANEAWEKLFGFVNQDEYTGKNISIIFETRNAYEKHWDASYDGLTLGKTSVTDIRLVRKDGSVFDANVRTKLLDPKRPFNGNVSIITDISDIKSLQEDLCVERRRFDSLGKNSPFGLVMLQPDGSFSYANPKFEEMFGYSLDDVPNGREWLKKAYPDPEYRSEVISAWLEDAKGSTTGESRPRVFFVTCKDGSEKIIQFRPVKLDTGEDLMTFEDITERKRAEDGMRLNETRLEKIVDILHYKASSVQDFLDHALEGALALTHSKLGYIYFYDEDREEFVLNTWSKEVMKECLIANPQTRYELEKTGIWGEAVRQRQPILVNDFQAPNPLKKGYPEGHASLQRYLTVPVYIGARIVAVVGVANKETDYSQTDILQLTLLMDSVWKGVNRLDMEKALRESETTLKAVLQTTPIGIGLVTDGMFRWINDSLSVITGFSTDELLGKSPCVLYRADQEINQADIFTPMATGVTGRQTMETRWKRKDGSFVDILLSSSEMSPGDPSAGIVFSAIDITERKLFQQDLEESEERMRLLLEAAPMGIRIATQGKYSYANPAFLRMFGYNSSEEIEGLPVEQLYVKDDRPLVKERNSKRAKGIGVNHHYSVRGIRNDGSHFDLETWGSEISYKGRRSTFRFLIDVTESNSLRAQLLQAQKMEAIGTLAGGIAHDFNNLLQVVLGYSEIMLTREHQNELDCNDLERIHSAAKHGAELVRSLLTFSRKVETRYVPVNLNQEIIQVKHFLCRTIPKTINIDLRLGKSLGLIKADPSQLSQIVMNLGLNAVDAMPNGGTLTIKTDVVHLDEGYPIESLTEARQGSYVLLSVSDSGQGMDEATLSHIFEPFFTTKEPGKGTGLGLATVYGIVKQHGGHVICRSKPGMGSSFEVYFPLTEEKIDLKVQNVDTPIRVGTETILLVEDEEAIRELGAALLNQVGYEVIVGVNGKDALEIYRSEMDRISLVLMDIIMPEMDGLKCLSEILKINHEAKVIITSGLSETEHFHRQMSGVKGFIHKPYDIAEFLGTIRNVLDHP